MRSGWRPAAKTSSWADNMLAATLGSPRTCDGTQRNQTALPIPPTRHLHIASHHPIIPPPLLSPHHATSPPKPKPHTPPAPATAHPPQHRLPNTEADLPNAEGILEHPAELDLQERMRTKPCRAELSAPRWLRMPGVHLTVPESIVQKLVCPDRLFRRPAPCPWALHLPPRHAVFFMAAATGEPTREVGHHADTRTKARRAMPKYIAPYSLQKCLSLTVISAR